MTYAPALRMHSGPGEPLYSGDNYPIGYYDAGIMRQIVNAFDVDYKVFSIPMPKDDQQKNYIENLLDHPNVLYSLVDKNKIVFVTVHGDDNTNRSWMTYIEQLGYRVKDGEKSSKRLKSFHRPTLLNAHFDLGDLQVKYVDPADYSQYEFDHDVSSRYRDPEIIKRLGDGAFIISPRIIERAIENLEFIYQDHKTQYYHDKIVYDNMIRNLRNHRGAFNIRIIFPDGFLKGNCFVSDHIEPGVDILTSRENLKDEICYLNGFSILAEPQSPKSRVLTDVQTIINFPQLFPKDEMTKWLDTEYKLMYDKLMNDEILANWQSIYQKSFKSLNVDWEDDLSYLESFSQTIYSAYQWIASGQTFKNSPWLFETVAISQAKPLDERVPIPCTVYQQIIPNSLATMAGYDFVVEEGNIYASKALGCHVVNDLDWLEMYESHGGHDGDDFFRLFYRTMDGGDFDGEKVVIAIRSPNGLGEYTIFRYIEDGWHPTALDENKVEYSFPVVDGNNWPQRLTEAIQTGAVSYSGLPSSHAKSASSSVAGTSYSTDTVMSTVNVAMSGANVGRFVNAVMTHSLALSEHRPRQLCSMESAIDNSILPNSVQDIRAIESECHVIMKEVIESGKPIDTYFFQKRNLNYFYPKSIEPNLEDGIITFLHNLTSERFTRYCSEIRKYAQENIKPIDLVTSLGQRLRLHSWATLRSWRVLVNNVNQQNVYSGIDQNISTRNWNSLYGEIINAIERFDRIEDRHDFVIGLYYNSLTNPTSGGKITDQIVMNRFVFPYLMEALIFYGIAMRPVMIASRQDKNPGKKVSRVRITEWLYVDKDTGTLTKYKDPVEYQAAHAKYSDLR